MPDVKIRFGTDGFRGIIADSFTFESVKRISRAFAHYLLTKKPGESKKGIIIGYDRRFLSKEFAQCIGVTLSGAGIPALLAKSAVPTPAVSAYIIKNSLPGGIVITASHNPPYFNGVKIKNEFGSSVDKTMTEKLELFINKGLRLRPGRKAAEIKEVEILNPYISLLKKYLDFPLLKRAKFKVVVDAMHGAGSGIVEKILSNTASSVFAVRTEKDVLFGGVNPEPIIHNLHFLKKEMKKVKADLGIALDGDADRIGAMSPQGRFINSHQAICLLLLHLIEDRGFSGKIVKSLNTTTMVDKIARHYNMALKEVPVGFKYIAQEMLSDDVLLGGEESGGIGFKRYMPERDGVLSGLLLLEMMAARRKGIINILKEMEKRFGHFVYMRRDLKTKLTKKIKHPKKIAGQKVKDIKTYDGTKFILEDESWLIIRASGTEPIVRIYAESKTPAYTKRLIEFGCSLI